MSRRPVLDWDSVALGSRSDRALARELGVSKTAVMNQRRLRGIPSYSESVLGRAGLKRAVPDDLGQVPDAVIAEREGVSRQCVHQWRKTRGIPSNRERLEREDDWDHCLECGETLSIYDEAGLCENCYAWD